MNIPILEIPGFTYPVTEYFKGDYEEMIRDYPIQKLLQEQRQGDDDENDNEDEGGRNNNNATNKNMIPFRKKDIDYDLLCKLVFTLIHPLPTTTTTIIEEE